MEDRSLGDSIRMEDFSTVYTGGSKCEQLYSGKYNGCEYTIHTTGKYPFIKIYSNRPTSVFSGYSLVILNDGDTQYDLTRLPEGSTTGYIYNCDNADDYVDGDHDGKKYTVGSLQNLVERLIDIIEKSEEQLKEHKI
jgi:hypothetical protein